LPSVDGAQPGEPLNPGVPASTVQPANGPAGPVSIKIGDVTYPTLDDAFAAQQASAEKAVAGVAALHAPTHGSLLIAIPVPEEPKTPPPINGMAPETIKALLVYSVKTSKIANEATAEAIRNSTIFSSVTIINANTVSDDFQGNDYLMKLASASAGKPYGWQLTRRQGGESGVTPVQVAPMLTTGNLIDLVKRLDSAASSLEKP
jgi:hypothetical protein